MGPVEEHAFGAVREVGLAAQRLEFAHVFAWIDGLDLNRVDFLAAYKAASYGHGLGQRGRYLRIFDPQPADMRIQLEDFQFVVAEELHVGRGIPADVIRQVKARTPLKTAVVGVLAQSLPGEFDHCYRDERVLGKLVEA